MKPLIDYYEKVFELTPEQSREIITPWLLENFGCGKGVTEVRIYIDAPFVKVKVRGLTDVTDNDKVEFGKKVIDAINILTKQNGHLGLRLN